MLSRLKERRKDATHERCTERPSNAVGLFPWLDGAERVLRSKSTAEPRDRGGRVRIGCSSPGVIFLSTPFSREFRGRRDLTPVRPERMHATDHATKGTGPADHADHDTSKNGEESVVTGPVTDATSFNEESRRSREAPAAGETPRTENAGERRRDGHPRRPTRATASTTSAVERLSFSFFLLPYRLVTVGEVLEVPGPVTRLSPVRGGGR